MSTSCQCEEQYVEAHVGCQAEYQAAVIVPAGRSQWAKKVKAPLGGGGRQPVGSTAKEGCGGRNPAGEGRNPRGL